MTETCIRCGGDAVPNGSGYKCIFCGATYATLDELKPKPRTNKAADPGKGQQQESSQSAEGICTPLKIDLRPKDAQNVAQAVGTVSEMSAADIYEQNCGGAVEILTESGRASGLVISKKGLVLTNAHAVLNDDGNPCSRITVKHGEERIPAHLIAIGDTDSSNPNSVDLALLVTESMPEDAVALKLGRSASVKIGQQVYYIGNSKGEGLCMTGGIVSDNNRKVSERYFIMTDAATNPGNSGGPLFSDLGEVIGVHVSARLEAVGMKYAIPMDTARLFLNTIEDKLDIPHDSLAEHPVPQSDTSEENVSAGVILTIVLSGISLLVKNIEYIKDIIETIKGK